MKFRNSLCLASVVLLTAGAASAQTVDCSTATQSPTANVSNDGQLSICFPLLGEDNKVLDPTDPLTCTVRNALDFTFSGTFNGAPGEYRENVANLGIKSPVSTIDGSLSPVSIEGFCTNSAGDGGSALVAVTFPGDYSGTVPIVPVLSE